MMTQYAYSPDTGELIYTDSPAEWMGITDMEPPEFDSATAGCFWRGDAWEIVAAYIPDPQVAINAAMAMYLDTVRDIREQVINRIGGIAGRASRSGDAVLATACDVVVGQLLNITQDAGILAATNPEDLKAAVLVAYRTIAYAAPVNARSAFDRVDL